MPYKDKRKAAENAWLWRMAHPGYIKEWSPERKEAVRKSKHKYYIAHAIQLRMLRQSQRNNKTFNSLTTTEEALVLLEQRHDNIANSIQAEQRQQGELSKWIAIFKRFLVREGETQ